MTARKKKPTTWTKTKIGKRAHFIATKHGIEVCSWYNQGLGFSSRVRIPWALLRKAAKGLGVKP